MKHENSPLPKGWFASLLPESLDFLPALFSPVLPSGRNVGRLFLVFFFAVLGVSYYLLESVPFSLPLAILLTLLISSIVHGWSNWGEWKLLRESLATHILRDKTRVAIHGRIHPLTNEPFFSPLFRNECVAYAYSVTRMVDTYRSRSQNPKKAVRKEMEGIGLTPCFVETKHGQIKLLAWPTFTSRFRDFGLRYDLAEVDSKQAVEYFRSALLLEMDDQNWVRGGGESMKAETGSVQLDAKVGKLSKQELVGFFAELSYDGYNILDDWKVYERFVPAGTEVCLIGVYSAERQAIVSGYGSTEKQVKLYEGHPSFLELYYRRSLKAIPVLAAITLALVGLFYLLRIS
jgi:hypothetical protein